MVCFTLISRMMPTISIIGDIINNAIPNVLKSEKNSILSTVRPVPKNTINVLKYAKNVLSLASFVRSMANQSLVINVFS